MEDSRDIRVGVTLLAILLATIIFLLLWFGGIMLINLLDPVRRIGDEKLGAIGRELLVPGVAGYAAMAAVEEWIPKANARFTFFGFSAIILIVAGAYIGFIGPIATQIGTGFWGMLLAVGSNIAALVGAYLCARNRI